MTFFKVATINEPTTNDFKVLIEAEVPHWLDGSEHNYLEAGADVGDQGLAMMAFGLGHLLGLWKVSSPATIVPFLSPALQMHLAEHGMVSIKA